MPRPSLLRPMRGLALLALAAAAVAPAACASGAASIPDDGTPASDRRFYEARCGVCHVPFHREAFPADRWPALVEHFAPRAGLTRSQRERVLRWLTAREPVEGSAEVR